MRQYEGISYENASREGLHLVKQAAKTGNWFAAIDKLAYLRDTMRMLKPTRETVSK